jgi:signal transduction histidine kinase
VFAPCGGVQLRTKLAVAILVITLLLSGATVAGLEFYKQQAVDSVGENVDETARLAAEQISESVRERRDYVGYIASRPDASNFEQANPFLDSFLANSRFYAARIVDENGTVVAYRGRIDESVRQRIIGSDESDQPYVRRAIEEGAYVSDVARVADSNRYVLVFSAPIFEDGEVEGVFAGAIFLNDDTLFDVVPPLETGSQRVTISAGSDALHESNGTFGQSIRRSATVESTGWQVTVERDRAALNRRLEQLALFQGAGLALVLFSMVGFGYWQYAVSLRQTERLIEGFDAIREGDYDYEVDLSGGTEWDRISDGVNELTTGLKNREAALRERRQRLEVLHRVLRHNVRNRMSIVLNYADIIGDTAEDPLLADAAETIEDASRDLTNLSRKAAQMESIIEEADEDPDPVDVWALAAEVAADVGEEYGVDIAVTGDAATALALPSLRLALENACENACKHNDSDDPTVEIRVLGDGDDGVRVEIRDDGPGIPEQDRNVIEEGRETDLEHGSGLGLWLIYWIVDNSGGNLSFAENDPRGTIVRIDLDAAPAETTGESATAAAEAADDD